MSERFFRLIIGSLLLACLYFDLQAGIPALIVVLTLEGITNYRIPLLVSRMRLAGHADFDDSSELMPELQFARIPFDAERAWRLTVAVMLVISIYVFGESLWFFPWFMGFAIFGAGLSGVCPVLISLKLLGFR
ncbi:MAG: hypothetical protein WCZ87_04325 [Thiohalobacteraceae bacterium]